jgi:hypothetical protein
VLQLPSDLKDDKMYYMGKMIQLVYDTAKWECGDDMMNNEERTC